MHGLDARELLDVWERGLTQSLPRRAVALLCLAWPDASEDEVLRWPIGLRDARLLALRRWLFGSEVTIVASCPSCVALVESTFGVDEVMLPESSAIEAAAAVEHGVDRAAGIAQTDERGAAAGVTHAIEHAGFVITFRPPGSGDLLALAEASARGEAAERDPRAFLLGRCVIAVHDAGGEPVDIARLPEAVQKAVAETMAAADPQADVQLACTCPTCGWTWAAAFDIASVLWAEIHAWARRTLRDVHALALAYGWREADVLSLSPTRRELYLELVGS